MEKMAHPAVHKPRVAFYTLGCKVNQYDTEILAALFREKGFTVVPLEEEAEVYVINTCTVTRVGDQKSRQAIHRLHRQHPQALLVVVGCYSQVAPQEVAAIEGVAVVGGTKARHELVQATREVLEGKRPSPVNLVTPHRRQENFEETGVVVAPDRTRAMVKVQEGCNQFCTYCRVPWARGPERSRLPESVLGEVRALVEEGYREIVLTGVHLGSYGRDLSLGDGKWDLTRLVRAVVGVPGEFRLRLSSIEPTDITEDLVRAVADHRRICPHFHVPLQSGDDEVLRRMGRRYDTAFYARTMALIRRYLPEAGVTTDLLVGFPGETEEAFARTVAFVQEMRFSRLHVFTYSRRPGTPAADFPGQVPRRIKEERSRRLMAVGEDLAADFHRRFVGRYLEVLLEEQKTLGQWEGWSENYIRVWVEDGPNRAAHPSLPTLKGRLLPVKVVAADQKGVKGEVAWERREKRSKKTKGQAGIFCTREN